MGTLFDPLCVVWCRVIDAYDSAALFTCAFSKWFDNKLFMLGYPLSLLTFEMAIVFVLNNDKTVDIFINSDNTGEIKNI
jgi:hypothetical protein